MLSRQPLRLIFCKLGQCSANAITAVSVMLSRQPLRLIFCKLGQCSANATIAVSVMLSHSLRLISCKMGQCSANAITAVSVMLSRQQLMLIFCKLGQCSANATIAVSVMCLHDFRQIVCTDEFHFFATRMTSASVAEDGNCVSLSIVSRCSTVCFCPSFHSPSYTLPLRSMYLVCS